MSIQGLIAFFPFTVTEAMVATFRDLKRSRNIVYAEHKVVSGLPKIEHTGRELDTVSLQIIVHPIIADALSVDARVLAPACPDGTGASPCSGLHRESSVIVRRAQRAC